MRLSQLFSLAVLFLGLTAFSKCSGAPGAQALVLNTHGDQVGRALFYDNGSSVKMILEVRGLSAGDHGMHIHGVGQCIVPDFKSAGPHFNPHTKKHGLENPEGHHSGDLPNLFADQSGNAKSDVTLHGVSLKEGQFDSLLQTGGTAIVIHAGKDDNVTDPAGNSGDRIACGVIQKVN